jgi:isoaspartyl peptidase/L-asparaginase-like protein (Ntn-hydrolase superfamily)
VRNPILLARAVMERTPHVFLGGPAAEAFAADCGLETVASNEWFTTPARQAQWEAYMKRGEMPRCARGGGGRMAARGGCVRWLG